MDKPWDKMTDDEKLDEVMNLQDAYRCAREWNNVLTEKLETLAAEFTKWECAPEPDETDTPFLSAAAELANWWIKVNAGPEEQ
jgi:hypothetical protein